MTYSIGGTTVIASNGTIDWSKMGAVTIYYGTSATRQVANSTVGTNQYGYKIESANSTSVRLVCTTFNCACLCDCTCFFANAMVTMADGSRKEIIDVKVGDKVLGAKGEINTVLALDQPILGHRSMFEINEEHHTSWDHPHVGVDGLFYSPKKEAIFEEWGNHFTIIDGKGNLIRKINRGLSHHRIRDMAIGTNLVTENGPKEVKTLREYKMDPWTPLYNLVIDGSHTYHVDGYAVTGWPKEDDFDYDTWTQIKITALEDYDE